MMIDQTHADLSHQGESPLERLERRAIDGDILQGSSGNGSVAFRTTVVQVSVLGLRDPECVYLA